MASDAALEQVPLTAADLAGGLALSQAAGWNQTRDDWALFFARGHVIGCRDDAGRVVATAAALPYSGGLGWVSMVLVAQAWQKRGLATRLLEACVAQLQALRLTPVLDATPAGAVVYERLGFEPGFAIERWEHDAMTSPRPGACREGTHRAASVEALATLSRLDAEATGLQRGFLLESFLKREGSAGWLAQDESSGVVLRRGLRAWQVGPLLATSEAVAIDLLRTALAAASGPVFLDVPTRWSALTAWLAAQGFRRQRPFVRMALGPAPIASANDHLFVLAGPEFG